jgi:hypothetical protein
LQQTFSLSIPDCHVAAWMENSAGSGRYCLLK